jgi:hypothetical protein
MLPFRQQCGQQCVAFPHELRHSVVVEREQIPAWSVASCITDIAKQSRVWVRVTTGIAAHARMHSQSNGVSSRLVGPFVYGNVGGGLRLGMG